MASLHGCASANFLIANDSVSCRPVEIRLPYTSKMVLEALINASSDHLTALVDGHWMPKFLLRLVAIKAGVPFSVAIRRKVPFNEGGTGVENAGSDPYELELASNYLKPLGMENLLMQNEESLNRLGISSPGDSPPEHNHLLASGMDHLGFFAAGLATGLDRLLLGNAFREKMPDALYSSKVDPRCTIIIPSIVVNSSEMEQNLTNCGEFSDIIREKL